MPSSFLQRAFRVAALVALLPGCFLFHGSDDEAEDGAADSGIERDARMDGASVQPDGGDLCEPLGIYSSCGEFCDPGCITVDRPATCNDRCGPGLTCLEPFGMCVDPDRRTELVQLGCRGVATARYFCTDPRLVCVAIEDGWGHGGGCFDPSYCEPMRTRAEIVGIECYYSDGTVVHDPPPDEECPPGPDPHFPFCGASCAGCDVSTDQVVSQPSCMGINAVRGIGLCTLNQECQASPFYFDPELIGYGEQPVTCLVFRHPQTGFFDDTGSLTGESACRAYRDLYPDDVDCRNSDWESI